MSSSSSCRPSGKRTSATSPSLSLPNPFCENAVWWNDGIRERKKNKTKWNEIIFGIHLPPPPPLCFFFLINNFSFFLFYDEFVLVFLNVLFVVFIPSKLSSPPNGFCCYIISQLLLWFSINSHQNVVVSSFSSVDIISELCWRTTQTQKKETLTNETRETLMAPGHVLVFVGLAKSVEKNGCERD